MKLTCDFKEFRSALMAAGRACGSKNQSSYLQSVLVNLHPNGGDITGTNNEIGIVVDFSGKPSVDHGKFLLPASKTITCLASVSRPDGDLSIEVKPTVIVLTYLKDGRSWKL